MIEHSLLSLGAPMRPADLCWVAASRGLVVFAHADGGAPTARRAQALLPRLQGRGYSTLDFDLLTREESREEGRAEDVPLLASRLEQALDHLRAAERHLPVALFGHEAGTAAAITVAVRRPRSVRVLASRSGRPDLVPDLLGDLRVPTLLIVGAADPPLVEANRAAYTRLRCDKRIDVVPRATHHFMEAGTMELAAQLAGDWFDRHLG